MRAFTHNQISTIKPIELTFGPLNKSLFTQEFELAIKTILKDPSAVSLKYEENDLHFKLHDIDINLSSLLKKVNFSHLELSAEDSTQYFNAERNPEPPLEYNDLTPAEIKAIRGYTGSDYYDMNNLLHQKTLTHASSEELSSILLKTAFLGSGLNKLPEEHHMIRAKTYRGDGPTEEGIQERIELIKNGEGLSDTPAFFSTSLDIEVAQDFARSAIIYFESAYGKDVSELSQFSSEREFLLEPCTLLWTQHAMQDEMHVFHARKVVPLIEGKDDPSHQDIETLSKLYHWANTHGVKTDSMTPHLKSVLSSHEKEMGKDNYLDAIRPQSEKQGSNISLDDCVKTSDNIVGLDLNENNTSLSTMPLDLTPDNSAYNMSLMMNELNLISESVINAASLC